MIFNKDDYSATNSKVINLIKGKLDWEDGEGFLADGIICPAIYEKQQIKVLVFLGESYGYNDCKVVSIENQQTNDILGVFKTDTQTARKVPALLWLIFQSIEEKKKMFYDDFPDFFLNNEANKKDLQDTLLKIAWVNVKKASNGETRQDDRIIYQSCFDNKDILELQLDSISPNLILVCGNAVINGLQATKLLGENLNSIKNMVQTNHLGQRIVFVNHPSHYGSWGYPSIYDLYEKIYDGFVVNMIK